MAETFVDFAGVANRQNLLVLATIPSDESRYCGGLIAEACLRGRPPFVAILADGSRSGPAGSNTEPDALAAQLERASRQTVGRLGVPGDWFLMLGLHDGTAPLAGRKFDAVVAAIALIMWRRDCNALVAPAAGDPRPDHAACHAIACAVAASSGVGLVTYPTTSLVSGAQTLTMRPNVAALLAEREHTERYFPLMQTG